MRPSPHARRDDRGVVAIEFVLVFPLLAMLLFGIVSCGLFLSAKTQASGLAYSRGRSLALNLTPAALPSGATATVSGSCLTSGQVDPTKTIDVTVKVPYKFQVPFIPDPNPSHMAASTAKGVRCGG
jgi:hypothetical protein